MIDQGRVGANDAQVEPFCANHPKKSTRVTCSSCGKPICPECMVFGPVGVKCKECAAHARSAMKRGKPSQFLGAALYGIAAALIGGTLVSMIRGVPFMGFLIYGGYGYLVGEAVIRGGRGNRGPIFMGMAGACAGLGGVPTLLTGGLWGLLYVGLAVVVAASRASEV